MVTQQLSPRVPLVGDDTDDERVAAVFAKGHDLSGRSPTLYRMLANSPELLEAWIAFAWPLRSDSRTPRALRSVIWRMSFSAAASCRATIPCSRLAWEMSLICCAVD